MAFQLAQIVRVVRIQLFQAAFKAAINYCWLRATAMASPKAVRARPGRSFPVLPHELSAGQYWLICP